MKKKRISVVISAFNEASKIEECLSSVSWADEIILVDNQSSDATVQKAGKRASKIFSRPNNPMLNVNKNFGFSKATGEWILSLDADERVTKELAQEIQNVIKEESDIQGYWISRKNIIFGKWIEHTGWYPDYNLRLFRKGKGKFPEKHVHEMISVDGETANLSSPLVHDNYQTISQFVHKHVDIYAPNEAQQKIEGGYVFNYLDAIRFPTQEFLSRFFAREGYKDGLHGLILSLLMSFYHLLIFVYIWQLSQFKEVESKEMITEVEKQFQTSAKETMYWIYNEKLKKIKNPIKKTLIKISQKLL